MRVGILGGTFDPVHSGHIELARAAIKELQLDKLLLIPSGKPSYKQPIAGRADRLTMTRLAAEGVDGVEVSDIEITRGGETYAVDTVKALKKQYPDDELIYIVGSDAASRVHHWKGIDKILKKVGEVGTEVIIAGKADDKAETVKDLLYIILDNYVSQEEK